MKIPGPAFTSIFQLIQLSFDPYPLLNRWREKYGPTFKVRVPLQPEVIFFTEEEPIRQIFGAGMDYLDSKTLNAFLGDVMGQKSIFLLENGPHRQMRKIVLPAFHGERLKNYESVLTGVTSRYIQTWKERQQIILENELLSLALEVILHIVLKHDSERAPLHSNILKMLNLGRTRWAAVGSATPKHIRALIPRWRMFLRVQKDVFAHLEDVIEQRRRHKRSELDFLDTLLEGKMDHRSLTTEEIRDQLLTFIMAGAETTSIALSWAVYDLLHNADELEAMKREIRGRVPNLPYTEAVLRESMRLHPVVPVIVRKLKAPLTISNQTFPAGTVVAPCVYLTHYNEEYYPQPTHFNPKRFFENKINPNTWFPFGGGHRICAGLGLSLYEMKTILGQIFDQMNLEPLHKAPPRMIRKGLFMTPSDGIPVKVKSHP